MSQSSISRRINSSITALMSENYEEALIHFFPALDKTAKRRYPREKGVGKRIKMFISDQEHIITALAIKNIIKGINVDGISFPDAIYKFGRCSIAHEGELDERLKISSDNQVKIGQVWELPPSYITGLIISVMLAPENKEEQIDGKLSIDIFDTKFIVNDLWGKQDEIEALINKVFNISTDPLIEGGSPFLNRNAKPLDWVETNNPVRVGSQVDVDFEGFIDGNPFDGGKAENFLFEIGIGRMIKGFDEGLLGKVAGDNFDINVIFPENYHAENLKGQPAVFKIKLNKIFEREQV